VATEDSGWKACKIILLAGSSERLGGIRKMKRMIVLSFAAAFCLCLLPHAAAFAGCGDRPGTPSDVRAEALSQSSIKFSWRDTTRPGEIPLGPFYDIEVTDSNGKSLKQSTTGQGYLFGGKVYKKLDFNKEYCFRIRARTEAGTQGCVSQRWSARVCATTYAPPIAKPTADQKKAAPPPPPPPPKNYTGTWAVDLSGVAYTFVMKQQGPAITGQIVNADPQRNGTLQGSVEADGRAQFSYVQPQLNTGGSGRMWLEGTVDKLGGRFFFNGEQAVRLLEGTRK
jgi:hypothetical protein